MANEWTALNSFWNGFGIPAYDESTVPDDAQMPYIAYEASISAFGNKVLLSSSLYYRSTSWQEISDKQIEISKAIGGGCSIPYTDGRLWIVKGTPFAQRLREENDPSIRRVMLQIEAEFQTVY